MNAQMPSGAEFDEETSAGMRPILPGSGQEFSVALGGNRIREQFTGKSIGFITLSQGCQLCLLFCFLTWQPCFK
jgi:hypothetical protein